MPPKKVTGGKVLKPAKKSTITNEIQALMNKPVEVNFSQEAKNNLLPWIGAGYHMVFTSGSGNLCGAEALAHSYGAARRLAAPDGVSVDDNPVAKDLTKLQADKKKFTAAARVHFADLPRNLQPEFITNASDKNNFDINTLQIWLLILNEQFNTDYRLGVITQGYNVSWNRAKKEFRLDFKQPTRAGDLGVDNAIVWIYNNNETVIEDAHNPDSTHSVLNHWVGFSETNSIHDKHWKRATDAWDLEDEVIKDLQDGVWVVTANCPGDEANNLLEISLGNFVRQTKADDGVVIPANHIWVERSTVLEPDSVNQAKPQAGLIPISNLKKIEKDMMAPKAPKEKPAISIAVLPGTQEVAFIIYRTIEPTTKIGRKYANPNNAPKKFVGNFTFQDSEFLLDTNVPLVNFYPQLTKIDGTSGRVKPRNLQRLNEPWGLPNLLPLPLVVPEPKSASPVGSRKPMKLAYNFDQNSPRPQLLDEMDKRGIKGQRRIKKGIYDAIIEFDEEKYKKDLEDKAVPKKAPEKEVALDTTTLPMKRLLADIAAQPGPWPPKMPPFWSGEIVLYLGEGDEDNADTYVKDYEGRVGRIPKDNLEDIKVPWGLQLDKGGMAYILTNALNGVKQSKPKPKRKRPAAEPAAGAPKKKKPKP